MKILRVVIYILMIGLIGCSEQENSAPKDTLFQLIPASESGLDFTNNITNQKDFNIFLYRNFYNGGGVGISDINNDGFADVYMTSNMEKNKLFLNKGGFTFEDITESAGVGGIHAWSTGVVMVDINSDGLLDIYVCNAGNVKNDNQKNELFINNGDLTFTDRADEYGLADDGFTTHAAFFDYDSDGDLDVYILNNSFIPVNSLGYSNKRSMRSDDWDKPEIFSGGGDKLMRNDNGHFVDVSEEAGIYGSLIGFGMGVTVGDVNNDLLPDIYVSNDFYERDYLYINQGDGTFNEDIKNRMAHISLSSMGADMADINNDGYADIFVTDMLPEEDERLKNTSEFESYDVYNLKQDRDFYHQYMQNTLQLNNADETFSEIAFYSGVGQTDWSWGALIFDMDNDGYRDIYVSNGIYHDLTNMDFMDFFANEIVQRMTISGKKEEIDSIVSRMPSTPIVNYTFRNNGDLGFSNTAEGWGLTVPSFSNGAAYGDLDNDGDLDLVVNNVNQPAFLYKNRSEVKNGNHFIEVELKGEVPNTFAVGSAVHVYVNGQILRQELIPARGFQSSVDNKLHFGLSSETVADSVIVYWYNGKIQKLKNVEAGQLLSLSISGATEFFTGYQSKKNMENWFTPVASPFEAHKEDFYIDFDYEGIVPLMLSKEGPTMVVADVNEDGLDDLFIGGATGQVAQLWIQSKGGKMKKKEVQAFEDDKKLEDTASAFFDADGDGDFDLYVGSGGNNKDSNSPAMADRFYLNDGKGNFKKADDVLPDYRFNTSVVKPHDFDGDGDTDLFIGSLSVSRIYGIDPQHFLLENDGKGVFKDITESKAYKFKDLGMVTDAAWHDLDNDGSEELIVVGQWMAPVVFKNSGRRLSPVETSLDSLNGWWNGLAAADFNNDGKQDLILGNRGENSYFKVDSTSPIHLFVNDFDNNGNIEQFITRKVKGKNKPLALKMEITSQVVSLKKENLSYATYAQKSIEELFPAEVIQYSIVKETNSFASIVAYNQGNFQFRTEKLPKDVQFSNVNRIFTADLNNDGFTDIVTGGNNFNFKPQFGRLDAGFAHVLKGSNNGFSSPVKTAIKGDGMVRSFSPINLAGNQYLIIGINDEKPQLYKINKIK